MKRFLNTVALVLFALALVCLVGPGTIAGAGAAVWAVSGFITWACDKTLDAWGKNSP